MKTICLTLLCVLCLAPVSWAATTYAIDINDADVSTTAPGWTGLDALHTGNGGSVVVDGVTFAPFSADGSRLRGTIGSPNPDSLVGDFIFDDGPGEAVGLLLGGAGDLQAGLWQAEIWIYDSGSLLEDMIVGWRQNTAETIVSSSVAASASGPAITFTFTSNGTSAYDVFVRENNAANRSRLNAVRITLIPEPGSTLLSASAFGVFLLRRRR